jgi:hypothetical protein
LSSGGIGIGTREAGGDPNFFSGNLLYAKDDGTGVLLESRVTGDVINIQGGSLIVDTLYDMDAGATLNLFATEAIGAVIVDPAATVNVTVAGQHSQVIARSVDAQTLLQHDGTEATETVVNFGSAESEDFSIVDGVVEILTTMQQIGATIEIHLNKVGASDAEFDVWIEASGDGITWVAIDESLRRDVIDKDGSSNFISDFSFNVALPVGGMFRVVATNNGANTLSMEKPADIVTANGGANGFSKKINLIKRK